MAEIKKIGKFEGIYQPPINADEVTSFIILLHGWGADAADMFGLAPILGQIKNGCAWNANQEMVCAVSMRHNSTF